jgi:multiple sugar transport system ATP-binding protein
LFDEPLASLDEPLRVQLRQEIRQLHQETGATSIYVTHDQREAMALGHRVAMLQAGSLQQLDCPQHLYQKPANRAVAAFFGSPTMNFFAGTLKTASGQLFFASSGFRLPLPAALATALQPFTGKKLEMGLRPEHLRPASAASETSIKTQLMAVEPQGSHVLWHLKCGHQSMTTTIPSENGINKPGTEVGLDFDLTQSRWFDAQSGVNLLP